MVNAVGSICSDFLKIKTISLSLHNAVKEMMHETRITKL